jgi:hypothetical protein
VLTASHFQQQSTEYRNVILVGLPSENSVTRSANDLLPQPFEEDGNSLLNGYGIYLPTSDRDASLGLMQIMRSPWVEGGTVLILTGNDPQGLAWAWDTILDPTSRAQFAGNVMLVGSQNRTEASSLVVQQVADVGNIPIIGSWLQGSGKVISIPVLVAIGTALFLIVLISWSIRWARPRKMRNVIESAEAEKDHER